MNVGLYFCACGESYVSDFPASCLKCNGELKIESEPTMAKLAKLDDNQLEHLWKLFSKVSFDKSDEGITERFLIWLPTTNRFAIWLWFADRYSTYLCESTGKTGLARARPRQGSRVRMRSAYRGIEPVLF